MGLVTPDYGLLFWTLLAFSILLFVLKRYAWKPILQALRAREDYIARSLRKAEEAKSQLEQLQEENRQLAEKARLEREKELQETRLLRERLLAEAKENAEKEYRKMLEKAREQIKQEKEAAQKELYSTVINLAVDISEKVLREQLNDKERQVDYINKLLKEMPKN